MEVPVVPDDGAVHVSWWFCDKNYNVKLPIEPEWLFTAECECVPEVLEWPVDGLSEPSRPLVTPPVEEP